MTVVINTQEELEALIVDGRIVIDDHLHITCNVRVEADIKAWNIKAWNIKAWNIKAWNINAGNINAGNINAGNINAGNINARFIDAGHIDYYAVCFAYKYIVCTSIEGRRENSKHFCLDGEIAFKEEVKKKVILELTQE